LPPFGGRDLTRHLAFVGRVAQVLWLELRIDAESGIRTPKFSGIQETLLELQHDKSAPLDVVQEVAQLRQVRTPQEGTGHVVVGLHAAALAPGETRDEPLDRIAE
jgi:hypothetical protein